MVSHPTLASAYFPFFFFFFFSLLFKFHNLYGEWIHATVCAICANHFPFKSWWREKEMKGERDRAPPLPRASYLLKYSSPLSALLSPSLSLFPSFFFVSAECKTVLLINDICSYNVMNSSRFNPVVLFKSCQLLYSLAKVTNLHLGWSMTYLKKQFTFFVFQLVPKDFSTFHLMNSLNFILR